MLCIDQALSRRNDKQQDYIRLIFIEMERAGLHELLNQDYKWTGGTIR